MFYPKYMQGNLQPWEQLPAASGTYVAGQLLNVTGGKLAAISTACKTKPQYLCMADATVADGENLPVARVESDTVYVTTLSAAAEAAAVGSLLEVTAGGLQADAAAAGVFELVYVGGTAAGDEVHGRFK